MAEPRKIVGKQGTNLAGDAAVRSHAHKRMDRMTLMGLIVPKVISAAKIPQPWQFDIRGARIQAGRGVQVNDTQAAHNLPRDLTLNGRSLWTYATQSLRTHPRLRLQFYYSSAATMTVQREANAIDSAWERTSMPKDWVAYVEKCTECAAGLVDKHGGLPPAVRSAGAAFKRACQATLAETIDKMRTRNYYGTHKGILDAYFEIYTEAVEQYSPQSALEALWRIYQMEKYRS